MSTEDDLDIIAQAKRDLSALSNIQGHEFVRVVALLLQSRDYEIDIESSRDYDLVAFADDDQMRMVIECKNYGGEQKVGPAELESFIARVQDSTARFGMFIATAGFSDKAKKLADSSGNSIRLVDLDDLRGWIDDFVGSHKLATDTEAAEGFILEGAVASEPPDRSRKIENVGLVEPLVLLMNPGSAQKEEIAELYYEISKLYRMVGGEGIDFRVVGSKEPRFMEIGQ